MKPLFFNSNLYGKAVVASHNVVSSSDFTLWAPHEEFMIQLEQKQLNADPELSVDDSSSQNTATGKKLQEFSNK